MKKISEHIAVYLAQKESLFSILGRVSINAPVFLFPLVFVLDNHLVYFLYKWLFFLILVYHIVYSISKLLASDYGITILVALLYAIPAYLEGFSELPEDGASQYFYYWLIVHIMVGVGSVFSDYILSDLEELSFFNFDSFWHFVVLLFNSHFVWFFFFWYF